MTVVQIVEYTARDTVAVLKSLLSRALRGEIRGLAVCYRTDKGEEESAFTGNYKHHPEDGLAATMRLSWRLTQARDRKFGPPS
jgi:hypothetical protein